MVSVVICAISTCINSKWSRSQVGGEIKFATKVIIHRLYREIF
jgi:hypothetical protein